MSKYLKMAITEHIAIKSPAGIFDITPSKDVRINPSPSGDSFWDDPNNLAQLNKDIEETKDLDISKLKIYTSAEELKKGLGL